MKMVKHRSRIPPQKQAGPEESDVVNDCLMVRGLTRPAPTSRISSALKCKADSKNRWLCNCWWMCATSAASNLAGIDLTLVTGDPIY